MDRCGGCAPLEGPESGTFIEARYPGISASFRQEKSPFSAQAGPSYSSGAQHLYNPDKWRFLLFIPLKASGRNGN
jgi:hypothetical protein